MRLKDKVALVTGAARGLGRSHALALAEEGADLVINDIGYDMASIPYRLGTEEEMNKVVSEVEQMGRRAIGVRADVSKSGEVKKMVDRAIDEFGRIDILVNNAGVSFLAPLSKLTDEQWDVTIDINLKGVFLCCRAVVPYMAKQKYGKIINISSECGVHGEALLVHYTASKFGVIGITQALAMELSHYNINVNAVCPGAIYTPMVEEGCKVLDPKGDPKETYLRAWCSGHYFRREILPQEISDVVVFLASEHARNITGQAICVTAGLEKKPPAPTPYFTL